MAVPEVMPDFKGAEGKKVERKYIAHLIDVSMGGTTPDYRLIGEDLEEYSVDMNPNTETTRNILGKVSVITDGYEPSGSVEPYYIRDDDPLSDVIFDIVRERKTLDNLKTKIVEVYLWKEVEDGIFECDVDDCNLIPTSYGGDNTGAQAAFDVNYLNNRKKAYWDSSAMSVINTLPTY